MSAKKSFLLFILLIGGALAIAGCGEKEGATITSTGTIEMTEINISARIGGTLDKILVDEGQSVKAGDLLAELDHQELDNQLASAQAALESAIIRERQAHINLQLTQEQFNAQTHQAEANSDASNQNLKITQNRARQQDLEMAQDSVDQAKAQLDLANKTFKRQEDLFSDGLIAQAQLDQALSQKIIAQSQYQSAINHLSLIQSGAREEEIAVAKSQTQSATAGVELAHSNQRLVQIRRDDITLASTQIEMAKAAIQLLLTQLGHCRITAPNEGVVSTKLSELGENVSPGANIFTMLDTKRPWLKVYLPLTQVERVRVGDKVQVSLDAFPNRKFQGQVTQIASEAEFTPRNFQTKEERVKQVFAVKIRLDNSTGILKSGMPADAEILIRK